MSSDAVLEDAINPRIRRFSQIPRKPVRPNRPYLEVIPAASSHRSDFLNTDGVSPISRLSSGLRSPAGRVVSSYFSPDSVRFPPNVHSVSGTSISSFVDLDALESEIQMATDHVVNYFSQESRVGPESEVRSRRNSSVYSEHGAESHAYPFFGMSAEEAALAESSELTSQTASSLNRGLEQSIIEARQHHEVLHAGLGQIRRDRTTREATPEQRTHQPVFELPAFEQPSLGPTTKERDSGRPSKWLPISLQWWFMSLLFLVSVVLGVAALLLTLRSRSHQGLGTEKNTLAFLFTWKFVPTLLAVIYITLVITMINDIKRTQPFARLSRPIGASAESALFLRPGSLWSDPFTSLRKGSNDGARNWALFWAALINIFALLLVGPFSAAFIYPAEVVFTNNSTFSQLAAGIDGPLELSIDDSILFRTISNVLLNTTTSAWVSNDYTVLPFWPSDQNTVPLGSVISSSSQEWTANTTVYRASLECNQMNLKSFANFTLRGNHSTPDVNLLSFVIGSEDGCSLGFAGLSPDSGSSSIFSAGGGWWSDAPSFSYPLLWAPGNGTAEDLNAKHPILLNTTSQCGTRSMFFFAEPYVQNQTFRALGQICTSTYFSASLPVTVSNTESPPSIIFDADAFESAKTPIASSVLNISTFEASFLSQHWSSKFQSPNSSSNPGLPLRPKFGGPLNLLGAQNGFDLPRMLANPNLVDQARQIKQRFLGESMIASFDRIGSENPEPIAGTTAIIERRIVVSTVVGIILAATMLLSALMLLLVAFHTRLRQRPLNLPQDPASFKVIASLISSRSDTRGLFEDMDRASEYAMRHKLAGNILSLRNGELYEHGVNEASQYSTGIFSDAALLATYNWCPKMLRGPVLFLVLASSVIIAVALAVLFGIFRTKPISQLLMDPESSRSFSDRAIAALAPYSVIPTLVSLGVMLCWASMVATFRSLQPYVSMARKATLEKRNPLSYNIISLLWTVGMSAFNRDFLFGLVAVCAVLSQILIVSMSGLLERNPGFQTDSLTVMRSMELRTVPAIFTVGNRSTPSASNIEANNSEGVLTNIFDNLLTSWLFSSVNEGVYNSTPPSWTNQDWAFAPLELTSVQAPFDTMRENSTSTFGLETNNITVQTPSLRGRLECIPIDMSNTSAWLTTLNFTDKAAWSGKNIPCNLTVAYELKLGPSTNGSLGGVNSSYWDGNNQYLDFLVDDHREPCCGDDTTGSEEVAIGYWSPAADDTDTSIVVQWITGHPFLYQFSNSTPQTESPRPRLIWKSIPKVAAVKCTPIFESANAIVNADLTTGAIQSHTIMDTPVADPNAWSSRYQALDVSTGVPYSSIPGIGAGFQSKPGVFLQNVSVSYGYLFRDIVLNAANAARIGVIPQTSPVVEHLADRTFSFRLPGLNTDFMSYTSLALSGNNKSALLDPNTLGNISSTVFSLFFKNFARANVTANDALFMDGTWGLQPLGAVVPPDLGTIQGSNTPIRRQESSQPSSTSSTTEAMLSRRVENLDINSTVAIICLCILSFIIATTVVIMNYRMRYLKDLPRDVDTVGSVLGFVYGSERLLKLATETVVYKDKSAQMKMVKMGWFEVGQKRRWGIEVVKPGDRFLKEFLGADRGFKEVRLDNEATNAI